ncbi:MAG: type I 3-dehydroquinate dehydratase [Promethearchaeota archaeon]|jgi:3-dehydroquinate dehydratase type I
MKYKICIPIPVKSAIVSEIAPTIEKVIDLNPDFIELRLDYIPDIQKITKDFIIDLINRIQPKIPVICTFRDNSEGGQIKIEAIERLQIIKFLIEAKPKYLDIEINTERDILDEIIDLALHKNVSLIYSFHDFDKTPTFNEALNVLENSLKKLKQNAQIDQKIVENGIIKLIFTAQSFEDNLVPLQLCKIKASKKLRLISFCMGDLGLFSRILCNFSNSFLTYSSFSEKTAPGQINITKLRDILNFLNFNI